MSDYQLLKLKLPPALDLRGKCRTQHFDDVRAGVWTRPVKHSYRDAVWPEVECRVLNKAEIAGKSPDQVKAIVKRLEAARATACGAE